MKMKVSNIEMRPLNSIIVKNAVSAFFQKITPIDVFYL